MTEDASKSEVTPDPSAQWFCELLDEVPAPLVEVDMSGKLTFLNQKARENWPSLEQKGEKHLFLDGLETVLGYLIHASETVYTRDVHLDDRCFEQTIVYRREASRLRIFALDVTGRRRTEEGLTMARELYQLICDGSRDGIWDWDLKGQSIRFSKRWKSLLGYTDEELPDETASWFDLIHHEDLSIVNGELNKHLYGGTPYFEVEHRLKHRSGEYRWFCVRGKAMRDEEEQAYRMAGSLTDITDTKKDVNELIHDAFYDGVTGLPNYNLVIDRLAGALWKLKHDEDSGFAVVTINLSRFKNINDSFGAYFGDLLLHQVGQRLEHGIRQGDTAARLRADEFLVLLEHVKNSQVAMALAADIKKVLDAPFEIEGLQLFVAFSMGVVVSNPRYHKAESLLRDADTALNQAKRMGGSHCILYDQSLEDRAKAYLEIEQDLRLAIDEGQFELYYQPIVSLVDSRISSLETLVRWNHPKKGLVSPVKFIPVAEETRLILPLGNWILRRACQQLKAWRDKMDLDHLTISVNVSPYQFRYPEPLPTVQRILDETGLEPRFLKLEITESAMIENREDTLKTLHALHDYGVKISLDDFGTGYASLAYLQEMPVDYLKVDQAFVKGLPGNDKNEAILSAIIVMARQMRLKVIVEGIADLAQMNVVRDLRADLLQGYLFSKPLPLKKVEEILADDQFVSKVLFSELF